MQEQQPQMHVVAAQPIWKDLLIPFSIIIAGAAIGIGLYFSAGPTAPAQLAGAPAPQEEVDRTSEVAEVTDADHRKGAADAKVTIVEYSDFDCPFCGRFHDAMNDIVASNDDVAWVYRHFPLEQLHPNARAIAAASECVAELGGNDAFWAFTDGYFAAGTADPAQLAATAGINAAAFSECVASGRTAAKVQAQIDNAIATGGRGTPWSIVIGPTGKTYPINGALPQAAVEQVIQVALDEA